MKPLKITYLLVILASFAFISCENEPLTGTFTDEIGGSGSGSGSGSGGGGTGSGTSTGDYFPRAIGNTWGYSISGGGTETLEMISTSVYNSSTYYDFLENENDSGSISKSAASYFTRIAVDLESPAYIITGTPIVIKFLQDDAAVGTTWENPVSTTYTYTPVGGSPSIPDTVVSMNYKYTMEEIGISRTVNGQTYDNVLHVSHVLETGLGTPDTTGDYYYAKDVGPIEYSIDGVTYKLTNYSLN